MIRSRPAAFAPFALAVTLVLLPDAAARAQTGHAFVLLDPPDAASNSFAADVNDHGVVLVRRPEGVFTWTESAGLQPLITDPEVNSRFRPFAMNNAGKLLGFGCPNVCPNLPMVPATWSVAEGLVFLPLTSVTAINNGGTIVGAASGVAMILRPGGSPQPIPGVRSAADVNDAEQVTGGLASGDAYVWTEAGGIVTIPRLPGRTDEDWSYTPWGINSQGQVVGVFQHVFDPADPESDRGGLFLWSASGGTVDLQLPYLEPFFETVDLNDRGHVATTVCCESSGATAPLLYKNGVWTDLNGLVPSGASMAPLRTFSINNDGWIAGAGTYDTLPFPTDCGFGVFNCPAYVLIPPVVDVTVNGADGPLTLGPGDPLQLQAAFRASGAVDPAELYIGFASSSGVVWFHPTAGLSLVPAPLYQGPLPGFGAAPLLNLPDASVLPPGPLVWFVIVDDDANGVVNADYFDFAITTVTAGNAGGGETR